jgi:hypothetical protein
MRRFATILALLTGMVAPVPAADRGGPAGVAPEGTLPKGWEEGLAPGANWGLAARYPLDDGIERDPDVFVFEGFEKGKVMIPCKEGNRFETFFKITDAAPFSGKSCSETLWKQGGMGGAARFSLPPSAHQGPNPSYFLRAYRKFDRSFYPGDAKRAVGLKGMGICGYNSKSETRGEAKAGGTCDGTNWYTVEDQFVGWEGRGAGSQDGYYWFGHMYSYMPFPKEAVAKPGEIKVNKPPTTRFSCYSNPKQYVAYDKWVCFEVGLYLNTPGKRDGEARYWVDGVLHARATNLCFRTIPEALPTVATFNMYRTTADFPQTMKLWMDNIVVARRYIGPVKTK